MVFVVISENKSNDTILIASFRSFGISASSIFLSGTIQDSLLKIEVENQKTKVELGNKDALITPEARLQISSLEDMLRNPLPLRTTMPDSLLEIGIQDSLLE